MSHPHAPRILPPQPGPGRGAGGPPPPGGPGGGSGGYGYGYGPLGTGPWAPVFPPPAGYGARAGAYLLDGFLSTLLFTAVFFGPYLLFAWLAAPAEDLAVGIGLVVSVPVLLCLAGFLSFAYHWLPHARSGQTPGKRVFGIKVVRLDTGRPPSPGPAAGRQLVALALGAATGIGTVVDLLWPLWDEPYRQSVHDKAVDTRVIRVRGVPGTLGGETGTHAGPGGR
ncbi:RDD family protein [Streptomonospora litoralis]|uniref:RDD family protein n=1 Tax=Streptomonospora litoralis TaxID=2498135 RepID=A0A4P6PZ84_9ACTN|nr:RDD family protein [Streptomonospora litoralis]QBI53505.1 RDD family protein [Streptomonospora litoralis]